MLSLGFFNPMLLWALPVAAVPIVIHLLNRRRFNRVPWAAMEYLLRAMKRNRRRMQMEHWLILLLRTLVVIFLVFLVTRPQLTGGGGILKARTHHIICLDDSASMAQRLGAGNVFKSSVAKVHKLVGKLTETNSGDLFTLVLSSQREGQPLLFAARVSEQLKVKVREALSGRLVGDTALNPGVFLAVAKKWVVEKKKEAGDAHYYLVTDSREHDFVTDGKPSPGVVKHLEEMDPAHAQMTLILVGPRDTNNLAVTAVRRRDRLAMANAPVTLEVEVTNFGDDTTSAAEVAVEIDGKSRVVRPVEPLAPGARAVVDIEHTFRAPGFHGVVASIKKDQYPVDDRGVLALDVVGTSEILVVNGDPASVAEDSETFFLNAALDSGSDVLTGITVLEIQEQSLAGYDLTPFNMVFLANVPAPRPEAVQALEKFVAAGGGLVMFLGDQVEPSQYNKNLYKDGKGLLPLMLGELRGDVDKPDHAFVADRSHFAIKENAEFLGLVFSRMVLVQRYFGMIEDSNQPVSIPVRVKGANGTPLIVSKTFGSGGYSIVIGTTADDAWTDFCGSFAYLPTCQEIHKYATRVHSLEPYNLSASGTLRLDLNPAEYRRDILLRALDDTRAFEATYTATDTTGTAETEPGGESTGTVSSELVVPMDQIEGLGLFQLTLSPHRGQPEHRLIARSVPVAEGRLQKLNKLDWLRAYPNLDDRLTVVEDGGSDTGATTSGEGEIWRLLGLVLLAFLLLETVLAWRFGRR